MKSEDIKNLKGHRKITMLTAYDYPTARVLSDCGIDIVLVGDSLGMVVLGYEDTKSVTLDDMIRHGAAVMRGNENSLVVIDMPIGTYDEPSQALRNVKRVLDETGASCVKIEGKPEIIKILSDNGIPVMGHTGLKPQTAEKYRTVGKDELSARQVFDESLAIAEAGTFSLVLECVPADLAGKITESLQIPTIGIGAGINCDGQVLVVSDMIGLYDRIKPKFVKQYADVAQMIKVAVNRYKDEVISGKFPT